MVITGGFKYLKSRYLWYDIDLNDLVERHKKTSSEKPILLIDCSRIQFVKFLNPDSRYGWEWHTVIRQFKKFVEYLTNIDIKPIFYFQEKEFEEANWKYWIIANNQRIHKIFDSLKNQFSDIRMSRNYSCEQFVPPGQSYLRYVIKYECNSEVYNTTDNHYAELADVAKNNKNCLGILSMNVDYIIFDTKPLLSMKKLLFNRLSTEMYLHYDFAKVIDLDRQQMKLLCCLVGNDTIPLNDLKDFHEKIGYVYERERDSHVLNKVAKVIKDREWSGDHLQFGEIAKFVGINEKELRKGMNFYEIGSNSEKYVDDQVQLWTNIDILREKWNACEIPPGFYTLLRDRMFVDKANFEDYDDDSLPSCALVYREMRQKMYRILFSEGVTIKEWCCYKGANLDEPDEVGVHKDAFDDYIPSLEDLMSEDEEMRRIRWDLLQFCLGTNMPYEKLQNMSLSLLSLCFILHYLLKQGTKLQHWEVKAFVAQALVDPTYKNEFGIKYTSRIIHLSELLQKGMYNLMYVITACGYPYPLVNALPWRSFNRKIFAWLYNRLPNERTEEIFNNNRELLKTFNEILEIVYFDIEDSEEN
ncbi:constitutive coactivator of peroxisome proliferator-activated receptor gamma-like isoform X1 [Centruroides sculpturatus]|uniref:constitutive coactivator of peroxisome proliferator-activated receptor gamma-like isoform X1 n=1 Tax=Centruroides sculpturatus TaxID=218467 RepID=UPI000C6DD15B|nr:constitutive coactivator of peroxisome proliferator-activated receptor gamma-like isoform X1 [Centruroides sculpturatus]XP_023229986.1 constitutive coactivator of peroxisome proliferator-activated receptor gamma-like isoform X1 [Centruroides sculpturatus]XP_023229987.1 constitutive coactivator of peroxisome proliferator-activated receptor gamma-like isoform X1 [Centruroides sculpturatus]XP_023229988.1 constitutive coactivator of peroxisome proliferator-activated receptor gamma-like isoform X1